MELIKKLETQICIAQLKRSPDIDFQLCTNFRHNTRNYVPNSLRRVCGFFNLPCYNHITLKIQETEPSTSRTVVRRSTN